MREGGREKEEKESREIQVEEESGQEVMDSQLIIFLPWLAFGRSGSTCRGLVSGMTSTNTPPAYRAASNAACAQRALNEVDGGTVCRRSNVHQGFELHDRQLGF